MSNNAKPTGPDANGFSATIDVLTERAKAAVRTRAVEEVDAIAREMLSIDDDTLKATNIGPVRDFWQIPSMLIETQQFALLEPLFVKAYGVLSNHPQAELRDIFIPLNNLAALYEQSGAYQSRDEVNSLIVNMADRLTAPIDEKTATVFANLGRLYEDAGHPKAVSILYRCLHQYAFTNPLNSDLCVSIAHTFGKALAQDGHLQDVLDMYRASLAMIEAKPDFIEDQRMTLNLLIGKAAEAAGDIPAARSALEQAKSIAERTQPDSREAGVVYHTLAMRYLNGRERYDEAEKLLEHAASIASAIEGDSSVEYAGSLAQLAILLDAKGDTDRALSLFQDAFSIFEAAPALKPDEHAAFLADAGTLNLRLGRYGDAAAAYRRAHQIWQAHPGVTSSMLANTLGKLATAEFELGEFPDAIAHYRQAIHLRYRPA